MLETAAKPICAALLAHVAIAAPGLYDTLTLGPTALAPALNPGLDATAHCARRSLIWLIRLTPARLPFTSLALAARRTASTWSPMVAISPATKGGTSAKSISADRSSEMLTPDSPPTSGNAPPDDSLRSGSSAAFGNSDSTVLAAPFSTSLAAQCAKSTTLPRSPTDCTAGGGPHGVESCDELCADGVSSSATSHSSSRPSSSVALSNLTLKGAVPSGSILGSPICLASLPFAIAPNNRADTFRGGGTFADGVDSAV